MPPLPPQVTWAPYQGVDDKVGMLLTTNYGEVTEQRIGLHTGPMFLQNGEPYMFTAKTDTLPTHFQVWRIEEQPKKWRDFYYSPTTKMSFVKANSNAGFLSHDIEPNKYYYYIFRAIDNFEDERYVRGKTMHSNPTDIFRIRMVSYENGIFLEMEPYDMEENKEKPSFEINFERFLKVKPNFKQTLMNFSKTLKRLQPTVTLPVNGLNEMRKRFNLIDPNNPLYIADTREFQNSAPPVEEITLGAPDFPPHERLWSKRFKIRIKSKNSGRAIDLNVKFVENQQTLLKDESE